MTSPFLFALDFTHNLGHAGKQSDIPLSGRRVRHSATGQGRVHPVAPHEMSPPASPLQSREVSTLAVGSASSGASPRPSRGARVGDSSRLGTATWGRRPPEARSKEVTAHLARPVGGPALRLPQLVGAARQQAPAAGQRAPLHRVHGELRVHRLQQLDLAVGSRAPRGHARPWWRAARGSG